MRGERKRRRRRRRRKPAFTAVVISNVMLNVTYDVVQKEFDEHYCGVEACF